MKPITEYTWASLDGTSHTIRIGHDNITETDVSTLRQLDRVQANDQRRYRRHSISLEVAIPYESSSSLLADTQTDIETETLDKLARETERLCLLEALAALSDAQRQLLDQVFEHELSLREIARREGVSDKAIRKRLQVILKNCKEIFRKGSAPQSSRDRYIGGFLCPPISGRGGQDDE